LNSWDVAAGAFIVEQAGGYVTDFSGTSEFISSREILATNSSIHYEFISLLNEHFF